MLITIVTTKEGEPIVSIQGDMTDTPEALVEAYLTVIRKLKEGKPK